MASPFPFVANAVLTAAQLNSIGEAWVSYTPTVIQGVAITKTIASARWTQVNKVVFVEINMQLTSAGTASAVIYVSLPTTASAGAAAGVFNGPAGSAFFYDASAGAGYTLVSVIQSVTQATFLREGGNFFGPSPTVTIANGDHFTLCLTYEAA